MTHSGAEMARHALIETENIKLDMIVTMVAYFISSGV